MSSSPVYWRTSAWRSGRIHQPAGLAVITHSGTLCNPSVLHCLFHPIIQCRRPLIAKSLLQLRSLSGGWTRERDFSSEGMLQIHAFLVHLKRSSLCSLVSCAATLPFTDLKFAITEGSFWLRQTMIISNIISMCYSIQTLQMQDLWSIWSYSLVVVRSISKFCCFKWTEQA